MSRDRFIYVWKYPGECSSGLPFYVGKGKHRKSNKYGRAYEVHKYCDGKNSHAQNIVKTIKSKGLVHEVSILYDNITLDEANNIEKVLIKRLGRLFNNTGILTNISEGGETNPMDIDIIRNKHNIKCKSEEHRSKMRLVVKLFNKNEEYVEIQRIKSTKRMKNIEYYTNYVNYCRSEFNIERQRNIQSNISGKSVIIDGISYRSIREASEKLNIERSVIRNKIMKGINSFKTYIEFDGIRYKNKNEIIRKTGLTKYKLNAIIKKNPERIK